VGAKSAPFARSGLLQADVLDHQGLVDFNQDGLPSSDVSSYLVCCGAAPFGAREVSSLSPSQTRVLPELAILIWPKSDISDFGGRGGIRTCCILIAIHHQSEPTPRRAIRQPRRLPDGALAEQMALTWRGRHRIFP